MNKIWNTYRAPVVIGIIIITIISVTFIISKLIGIDIFGLFYAKTIGVYFGLTVAVSNFIFEFLLPGFNISDQALLYDNTLIGHITDEVLSKKWLVFLGIFIWIIPETISRKMVFSFGLIGINFLLSIVRIVLFAYLLSMDIPLDDVKAMAPVISNLSYQIILFTILYKYQDFFINQLSRIKVDGAYIRKFFPTIVWVVLLSTLFNHLILGFFEFNGFIKFILINTQALLSVFGYESVVDGRYLYGENGNVYMAEFCIGLRTMMTFSIFVFLTGIKLKPKLIYILAGLVGIIGVNIIRIALLFIHMQKHGEYTLNIDVHDLFNYVIYTFVFILWIIWLERFTDIWPYLKKPTTDSNIAS